MEEDNNKLGIQSFFSRRCPVSKERQLVDAISIDRV